MNRFVRWKEHRLRKRILRPLSCLFVTLAILLASLPQSTVEAQEVKSGNISFMPNVIPNLVVSERVGRHNESFRFEWEGNSFDIELFFNSSGRLYSLDDFEDDFDVTVQYVTEREESLVRFGWVIDDVEAVSVDSAWFKIEDSSFDYELIEQEHIEFPDFNSTIFHLPDNLQLSFDDLIHKGFVIGWQNKTATNVKGFSGKASWDLDPITYSDNTMTMTGYSEGSEGDYWEFWNASDANSWDVAWNNRNNDTQFQFDCNLQVGDGENLTWFKDQWKQVTFHSSLSGQLIKVKENATFSLGELVDATEKTTWDGCEILATDENNNVYVIYGEANSEVNLYSTSLRSVHTGNTKRHYFGASQPTSCKVYNCLWDAVSLGVSRDIEIFNLIEDRGYYGMAYPRDCTFDKITMMRNSYALYFYYTYQSTVKNVLARKNTKLVYAQNLYRDNYLVNVDADEWTITWITGRTYRIYRQYTFTLNVTDNSGVPIEGANVTVSHYGQGYQQDFSVLTGSNGSFSEKTLTMGFYNQTGGNTIYNYNPHQISITHDDYDTKTFNFTLEDKTEWIINMETPSATFNSTFYLLGGLTFLPFMLLFALLLRRKQENGSKL